MVLFGISVARRSRVTGTPEETLHRKVERFEVEVPRGLFSTVRVPSDFSIQRTGGLASRPGSCRIMLAKAKTHGNGGSEMLVLPLTYESYGAAEPMEGLAVRLRAPGAEVRV